MLPCAEVFKRRKPEQPGLSKIKFTNSGGLIAQRGMISVGFQNFKSRGRDSNPGINALQAFPLAAWVPLREVFGVFHVL